MFSKLTVDGASGETGPNVQQLVATGFINDSASVTTLHLETVDYSARVTRKTLRIATTLSVQVNNSLHC